MKCMRGPQNKNGHSLQLLLSGSGVTYKLEQKIGPGAVDDPFCYGSDSKTVALLTQLEEEGFAELCPEGIFVSWDQYYQISDSNDYKSSIPLLKLPRQEFRKPTLSSKGSFTDDNFKVTIEGWMDSSGLLIKENVRIDGAIFSIGQDNSILPKASYDVVKAVAAFHNRSAEERNTTSNKYGWALIRQHAIKAGAGLSDFLRKTIVLTPERLKLSMRKAEIGNKKTVEIMPTFNDAPERWLEFFDKFSKVQERYEIPDGEGLIHVIIAPEIKTVLREVKNMPGRRIAGDRAEAFIRNPFALLGPDANKVLDPDEFEESLEDAGFSFSSFIAQALPDEKGFPKEVILLIEEVFRQNIKCDKYTFKNSDELEIFINKLEDRIGQKAQFCFWEGYDLEIQGDTSDQLLLLKDALRKWKNKEEIKHIEIFDLSNYSERVEGFGTEKPYYSPFIARKNDDQSWIPENIKRGIWYTPENSDESVFVEFTAEAPESFENKIRETKEGGGDSFTFPECPQPINVKDAEEILAIFNKTKREIHGGTFDPTKKCEKVERKGLVVKPNILKLDYSETDKREPLKVPEDARACLPNSLKSTSVPKNYQLKGIAWLQHLWKQSRANYCRGAVLADDMGLGKTLQMLSFIGSCLEEDPGLDPVLVVAPVSLLENWREEIDKFFNPGSFSVLTLYGSNLNEKRLSRNLIDEQLKSEGITRLLRRDWLEDKKIVLTTYETMRDLEFSLALQKWSIMICDEAQKIKNPNALVTRAAKKQNVKFKIACTGTPVENTLTDLWCLYDFVQPGLLGALNDFGGRYRKPIEAETEEEKERVNELRSIIAPQILRRLKKDVENELPLKIVDDDCRHLEISSLQRNLYGHVISLFRKQDENDSVPMLKNHLGLLQYLRRLCSDPRPIGQLSDGTEPTNEILRHSPKMFWLLEKIKSIREKNEKAIIFCELRDLQRTIQRCIFECVGFTPDIINGEVSPSITSASSRQKRIKAFQDKPGFSVIILSPLAVGFGVNIQAANHVIHFTRSWNPAKEDQATDRAYRIGQTKDVHVYYPVVVAKDFTTFDAKLDTLLNWKRGLSDDMLNGTGEINSSDFGDIEDVDGSNVFGNDLIGPEDILSMSPELFESFCAVIWSKHGSYKTYRTPHSGDGGIDVVGIKGKEGILIQCKTSSREGHELGWEAVKDVMAGAAGYAARHHGVTFRKVAATNQFFNAAAHNQAHLNHIDLVDRKRLVNMLSEKPVKRIELDRFLFNSE